MSGLNMRRKVLVAKTALEHLGGCSDLSLFGHPNPPEMWLLALQHMSDGIVPHLSANGRTTASSEDIEHAIRMNSCMHAGTNLCYRSW